MNRPMTQAGDRLYGAMQELGPLCVGIDPHPGLLRDWGLQDSVDGLERFAMTVAEAMSGRVASIKPQVALFERHGSGGIAVLERVIETMRGSGTEVICDAKRGDIGSTMAAYADAWLGASSPLAGDFLTVSPYLGFGSLDPAMRQAEQSRKGTFVLALTSNPEGAEVQHQGVEKSVAKSVVEAAYKENERHPSKHVGPCGLVVGATVGDSLDTLGIHLSEFNGLILAPGYGAQGASEEDLAQVFRGCRDQVVVSSSRGVLRHGPDTDALVREAIACNSRLRQTLHAG
ncbi:orotidine-5'-phosphate decarboxylase [Kocuria massiliensis]|uniref:orotidine-5'-phosphate decarboxylase n=1 Tax=Kocuria massiliensis TaxID=1926282 RepID=UPI001FE936E8|nr:orotidine-5'-phosphate decarboxylase [Kocuria massiliensis]